MIALQLLIVATLAGLGSALVNTDAPQLVRMGAGVLSIAGVMLGYVFGRQMEAAR
jgi:hypothetical protein